LREKHKIGNIKITKQEPEVIATAPVQIEKPVLPKESGQEKLADILQEQIVEAKKHASEVEKQQIFQLQSDKANLEGKMKVVGDSTSLQVQKNALLVQKEQLRKKLGEVPQGEDAEKKQWVIEGELTQLERKISALEREFGRNIKLRDIFPRGYDYASTIRVQTLIRRLRAA
jgi:hypothetical protein